ncbi:glycosyltransferase family 4 protein [Hymenobacter glaciei]|uniref:Glycosyltransferase family 4 protein n=1 Tax=Hymenobacter glaciei TaxID=877209 RepID=A0ABP7U8Q2_9BACT
MHLPKWYPHRYDDQDGDFVARHVAAIAAHGGVDSAVLFAAVARGPLPGLVEADEDFSGPVPTLRYYYRATPTGLPLLDKPLKLLLYFWCLLHGYRRLRLHWGGQRPDLVHVHVLLRTGLFAWVLRAVRSIPFIITEHWTLYLPERAGGIGWWRLVLTRAVVRRAAAVHTVSRNLANALAALGIQNARTAYIPNVVDTDLFYPPPVRRSSGFELLHTAAFNEAAKNLTGLLRTVAGLRTQMPELRLRIGGYGPDEALVRQQAATLGLLADGTVTFLGKLTHAQVATEMRAAACFVLFSNVENLPCVLIEAQASGLPAVATHVGGVPELLPADGRYGRLVTAGDETELAEAILATFAAPPAPEAMRARALAEFSEAAVGLAFGKLYQQVLDGAT